MFDRLTHRRGRLLFALAVLAGVLLLLNRSRQRGLDDRLIRAARDGDLPLVEARLREGASPNAAESLSSDPLRILERMLTNRPSSQAVLEIALLEKRWNVALRLVERGAVVRPRQMARPMHLAAEEGEVEVVRMLLDQGVSVEIADSMGRTPLELAIRANRADVVELLLERRAKIAPVVREDRMTISFIGSSAPVAHLVTLGEPPEAVRRILTLLKERGLDVNSPLEGGRTMLMVAAGHGPASTIELLLEQGADPDLQDDAGRNASDYARIPERQEIRDTIEQWKKRERIGR